MTKKKDEIKRLYRSEDDKIIAGVAAGIADHTHQDPTIIRLITVLITVFTGFIPGLVAYFILALIIPVNPNK